MGLMKKVVCFAACFGLTACDTSAELTFEDEQLIELAPLGILPSSCGQTETDSGGNFRFTVMTSSNAPMVPGRRYSALGEGLMPGENFSASDVIFSDGWLFEVGEDGMDKTCQTASDCLEGASCLSPDEMGLTQYHYAPQKTCVFGIKISTVSPPRFWHFQDAGVSSPLTVSAQTAGRTISFILDNSATLDGSAKTGIPDDASATDPYQYRKVGLNQFMDSLELRKSEHFRWEFSAHFADGIGQTGVNDMSEAWIRTPAVWESAVMNKYPTPSGGSPIWEAALSGLKKILDSADVSFSHSMVVLSDGRPNDGTEGVYAEFMRMRTTAGPLPVHWFDYEPSGSAPYMDYAKAANESCGSYHFFDSPVLFSNYMRVVALNSESYWSADVSFDKDIPAGHIYRLATMVTVKAGRSAVTYDAQRKAEQSETMDYRFVLSR